MSERTGSFPYMNLAQDLGVPYGDVLLASMGYDAPKGEGHHALTEARWKAATAAFDRIDLLIQANAASPAEAIERWAEFGRRMMALSDAKRHAHAEARRKAEEAAALEAMAVPLDVKP